MRELIEILRYKMVSAESSTLYNYFEVSQDDFEGVKELLNFAEKMYDKMVGKNA